MKTITFGEMMLRLSTPGFKRFTQTDSFDVTFGGGEANVAVSLAHFGMDSYFVSKLPPNDIGQAAVNHLRRYGVSERFVVRGGDRIGIYFLETGASQRSSKVVYDRANSAVSTLAESELDLDAIFDGAGWFHWTGITPALGQTARDTLNSMCKAAKQAGATVSCDLNYRAKLWSTEEAQSVMPSMMEYVDVCIANEEDVQKCLGFGGGIEDVESGHLNESGYADLIKNLKKEYGFSAVAVTLRESFSASMNGWSAIMMDDADCAEPYRSSRYEIKLIDRVGGGDAFSGGLIAGLSKKDNSRDALEFAVAASCLKQTIPGDFNHVTEHEVDQLVAGSGSGRVER